MRTDCLAKISAAPLRSCCWPAGCCASWAAGSAACGAGSAAWRIRAAGRGLGRATSAYDLVRDCAAVRGAGRGSDRALADVGEAPARPADAAGVTVAGIAAHAAQQARPSRGALRRRLVVRHRPPDLPAETVACDFGPSPCNHAVRCKRLQQKWLRTGPTLINIINSHTLCVCSSIPSYSHAPDCQLQAGLANLATDGQPCTHPCVLKLYNYK